MRISDWSSDVCSSDLISFFMLDNPEATVREQGPVLLPGVPAHYDPMPVLRNLDTPQLWILGADDRDAPSAETVRRLRALQAAGTPITVVVFPGATGSASYRASASPYV